METKLSTHAAAAKAIREELTSLKVKASVHSEVFAGGSAVTVIVNDLSPAAMDKVREACKRYQYGTYKTESDMYESDNIIQELPQVKYVQIDNRLSKQIKERITNALISINYPDFVDMNTAYGSETIYRMFRNKDFWERHLLN